MSLDSLLRFLEDTTKVWVTSDQFADMSTELAQEALKEWDSFGNGHASKEVYFLILANGGTIPAQNFKTTFERGGYIVIPRYLVIGNYDGEKQLGVPKLKQRLDQKTEREIANIIENGGNILVIDEMGDSGRSIFLTKLYLTSLLTRYENFETLYDKYVSPLESMKEDHSKEQELLMKLRCEVPEYEKVENATKIALANTKAQFDEQQLVTANFIGRRMGSSWVVYDWECFDRISRNYLVRASSFVYHRSSVARNIVDQSIKQLKKALN